MNETAEEEEEHESGVEAEHSPPEVDSESENQYDDLYVFIPGDNPENNSQEPLVCPRPPLPPPRPVTTAFQVEKPHFPVQGKFKFKTTLKLWHAYIAYSTAVVKLYKDHHLKPRGTFLLFFNNENLRNQQRGTCR